MPQDSGRDFYGILGVGKDADEPALKKAYKKLAMKYHPDRKTGDERMFKEVAEAYAVLSDPEKRKVYDRFGEEGLKAGMTGDQADNMGSGGFGGGFSGGPGGTGGFSMPPEFAENLFSQFFGGSRSNGGFSFMNGADDDEPFMFSSMGGMPGGMGGRMGGGMGGMGGMPGMGGMGGMPGGMGGMSGGSRNGFEDSQRPAKRQKRPPVEKDFSVSLEDLYTSATKKLKITRKLFNESTNSYTDSQQVVELKLKPQMKEGTKFTFKNLGSEEPGYEPADMIFKLKEKPHEKFTRKGDDLYVVVDISLKDALQGGQAIVQTLDKQNIRVPFSTLKESKHEVTLRERGMPNTRTGNKGNLIVRFNVRFPEDSSTRSELVEKLSKV